MGGTKAGQSYSSVSGLPQQERRGGYTEIGELGRGGFSVVKRVEWPAYGLVAALKMVTPNDPAGERAVRNEISALTRLQHPVIPVMHDSWQDNGTWNLLLELVEGDELLSLIPLQERRTRGILQEVSGAIKYAHQRGFVFSDTKPENIIVTPNGPKLVDWGAAARLGRSPTIGLFTPGYAPDEQRPGNGGLADPEWDWHALGVTMYVCLTGDNPATASVWKPNLSHPKLSARAQKDIETLLQGQEVSI